LCNDCCAQKEHQPEGKEFSHRIGDFFINKIKLFPVFLIFMPVERKCAEQEVSPKN